MFLRPSRVLAILILPMCFSISLHAEDKTAGNSEWVVTGQTLLPNGAGAQGVDVRVELGGSLQNPGKLLGEARSGGIGDFRIVLPGKPEGTLFLRAEKKGHATAYTEIQFDEDDPEAFVSIDMAGAQLLRGRVLDEASGKGIPEAVVDVTFAAGVWRGKTDPRGGFEAAEVCSGPAVICVVRDGFAHRRHTLQIQDGDAETEIRMEPARPVQVRVVDDLNRCVADVDLFVRFAQGTSTAKTSTEGVASLQGISTADKQIILSPNHPDYVMDSASECVIKLPNTTTSPAATQPFTYTLAMKRAGRITGVVTSDSGAPVVNARILVGEVFRHGMPMQWTDGDGRFEIGHILPGLATVTIQHSDFAPVILSSKVDAAQATSFQVILPPGQPLAGVVVDENGKALDQITVSCQRWQNRDTVGMRTMTDEQGRFQIEHAPEGPLDFRFVSSETGASEFQILRAGKTDYRITMKPPAPRPAPTAPGDAGKREDALMAVGRPAPDLSVTALDGKKYRLSELKGSYVFIDVWATWCPPCRAEMPILKQLWSGMKDHKDFVMLGVSLDQDPAVVKKFAEQQKIEWPLAAGADSGAEEVADKLGARYIPFNILVGPDGVILAVEIHGENLPERIQDCMRKKPATSKQQPQGQ